MMNQKFQNIFEIIQQSEKLDVEQKDKLLKAVKEADKELEITAFKLERTEKVKKTTAILLEETIEELEQKRKAVEAQNRELEIEASLERVRAVAMGMKKSEDLLNICEISFKELKKLGFDDLRNAIIHMLNDEKQFIMDYDYSDSLSGSIAKLDYNSHQLVENYLKQIKRSKDAFAQVVIEGDQLNDWKEFRRRTGQPDDPGLENTRALYYYFHSIGVGDIGISTFKPITESQINILKKFRNVFDLAYQRYNDIALAEAQAREAQIETALERVRSRSMAMHKSEELADLSFELVKQVQALGVATWFCAFNIYDDDSKGSLEWGANADGIYPEYRTPREGIFLRYYEAGQRGETLLINEINKEEISAHYDYLCSLPGVGEQLLKMKEAGLSFPDYQIDHVAYFKFGYIIFITYEPVPEVHDIFKRFAKVFEQTYTRFLDLQKAEAQAKEAEIELSLERIRARSMAMQKSEELKEVIKLVYEQFVYLKINVDHAGFVVDYTPKGDWHFWIADQQEIPSKITHPYFDSVWAHQFNEAKEKRKKIFATNLNFEEKNKFYNELLSYVPGLPDKSKEFYLSCPGLAATTVLFDNVSLYIENFSGIPYTDEENKILMRFGKVFQQTYTRFLDLKKAEAQARESQIELALERVRARTMAMHNSQDVGDTVVTLFDEVLKLGLDKSIRCGIGILEGSEHMETWSATSYPNGEVDLKMGMLDMTIHPMLIGLKKAWENGEKGYTYDFIGDDIFRYYDALNKEPDYPFQIDLGSLPENEYHRSFFFTEGILFAFAPNPISEEASRVLDRFTRVFGQTYRRYLDLQKAEEQAREAQMEASLEKVRAVAMSMNKSEELLSICEASFKEFKKLGFDNIRNALIHIQYDEQKYFMDYDFSDLTGGAITKIEYGSHPVVEDYLKQINSAKDAFYQGVIKEDQLEEWKEFRRNSGQIDDPRLEKATALYYYFFSIGVGDIGISTLQPIDESQIKILKRFRNVFDLAYRRYNDIALAEEQAIEAQIQLALERIRARTMAMHHTSELQDVINTVHQQFKLLDIAITGGAFIAINEENINEITCWGAGGTADYVERVHIPFLDKPIYTGLVECIQKGPGLHTEEFSYEEKVEFFNHLFKNPPYNNASLERKKEVMSRQGGYTRSCFVSKFTSVFIINHHGRKFSEEENNILIRFGNVFEQSYTRFLDLKKAEAQARESKVEASLERVRSLALGMRKSEEVGNVTDRLFTELTELSVDVNGCSIVVIDEDSDKMELWRARSNVAINPFENTSFSESMNLLKKNIPDWFPTFFKALEKRKGYLIDELSEDKRSNFINTIAEQYKYSNAERSRLLKNTPAEITTHFLFFKLGYLALLGEKKLSDENLSVVRRFVEVFEFSYTRFLDIKKAEDQARESKIEAALERVRSRTMAMQRSDELAETASHLFDQLYSLGIRPYRFNIAIVDPESEKCRLWSTTNEGKVIPLGPLIPLKENSVFTQIYDGWIQQDGVSVIRIQGEDRITWTKYIMNYVSFDEYKPENINLEKLKHEPAIFSNFFFKQGFIVVHTIEEIDDDDIKIIQRFVNVFEQTYTRFLDLQKAEVQAREAIKQACLDRVRGEIASMRTSEDLNRITPIIWRELKNLEVPFFRCGIFIVDENNSEVLVYLTTPDGKSLGVLSLPFDINELTKKTIDYWRKKKVYREHWDKVTFINWTKSMIELGQVQNEIIYQGSATPPESLDLHFVPFTQGMLYVGDTKPLTDEKLDLVKTLAEAFSIAYARYEDFKNLEEAKNKIEITLSELKSAQTQLIHSEKMASLGELTAGIAHEIKNPLNFVNNFSEVSRELLDEMKVEIDNNNIDEIIEIVELLNNNLEKINHHGKRADSIVKGMLLHSRGSSGEKVLTNINDLLDQYLMLAYHGMRAQDKDFNITIEKDYDQKLEKSNVIPQDLSRVFLNIINNACYACTERKKTAAAKHNENGYSPTLNVATKNLQDRIEISIRDNGNGIPDSIKSQIFNPFFSTKPTGEGTGLGLSLSYDIITKVHGGEIKYESVEGEFTKFIISLPKV